MSRNAPDFMKCEYLKGNSSFRVLIPKGYRRVYSTTKSTLVQGFVGEHEIFRRWIPCEDRFDKRRVHIRKITE